MKQSIVQQMVVDEYLKKDPSYQWTKEGMM
jgi:hypothetical protein